MALRRPRGRSVLELRLVALMRHAGIAGPVEEYPFARHLGRRWRFDFAWPDRMVAVEVDGGIWMRGGGRHSRGAGYEADARKLNTAALLGWCVLRFTRRNLQDGSAILAIRAALATAGQGPGGAGPPVMSVTVTKVQANRGTPRPNQPVAPSTTAPIRWKRPEPVTGAVTGAEGMTAGAFPLHGFVWEPVARTRGRTH